MEEADKSAENAAVRLAAPFAAAALLLLLRSRLGCRLVRIRRFFRLGELRDGRAVAERLLADGAVGVAGVTLRIISCIFLINHSDCMVCFADGFCSCRAAGSTGVSSDSG